MKMAKNLCYMEIEIMLIVPHIGAVFSYGIAIITSL